jgi:hypothetical protein
MAKLSVQVNYKMKKSNWERKEGCYFFTVTYSVTPVTCLLLSSLVHVFALY